MTLKELRSYALTNEPFDIQWEKIDENELYRKDFEKLLRSAVSIIPKVERIYLALVDKKSPIDPTLASTLDDTEREEYIQIIEEELIASYVLEEILHRYQAVMEVTR